MLLLYFLFGIALNKISRHPTLSPIFCAMQKGADNEDTSSSVSLIFFAFALSFISPVEF